MLLIAKPSISIRAIYTMARLNNQMVNLNPLSENPQWRIIRLFV